MCSSPPPGLIPLSIPGAAEPLTSFRMNETPRSPPPLSPTTAQSGWAVLGPGSGSRAHVHKPQRGPAVSVVGLRHRSTSAGGLAAGGSSEVLSRAGSWGERAVSARVGVVTPSHRRPTSNDQEMQGTEPGPLPGAHNSKRRSQGSRGVHLPLPQLFPPRGVCPRASLTEPLHLYACPRTHTETHTRTQMHTEAHI